MPAKTTQWRLGKKAATAAPKNRKKNAANNNNQSRHAHTWLRPPKRRRRCPRRCSSISGSKKSTQHKKHAYSWFLTIFCSLFLYVFFARWLFGLYFRTESVCKCMRVPPLCVCVFFVYFAGVLLYVLARMPPVYSIFPPFPALLQSVWGQRASLPLYW